MKFEDSLLKTKTIWIGLILLLAVTNFALGQKSSKCVLKNTLISDELPKIKIAIDKKFKYIGSFDFKIRDVAVGERYVFVDAEDKKIKRLFIAQFEGFLPNVDDFYRYNFDNAEVFGTHKFRQNNFAYSNKEAEKENPQGEATLTKEFLEKRGYSLEDELMLSRFLTVPDTEKKHELILFYIENVSETKHNLSEFYKGDDETEIWKSIAKDLTERSLKVFDIK